MPRTCPCRIARSLPRARAFLSRAASLSRSRIASASQSSRSRKCRRGVWVSFAFMSVSYRGPFTYRAASNTAATVLPSPSRFAGGEGTDGFPLVSGLRREQDFLEDPASFRQLGIRERQRRQQP